MRWRGFAAAAGSGIGVTLCVHALHAHDPRNLGLIWIGSLSAEILCGAVAGSFRLNFFERVAVLVAVCTLDTTAGFIEEYGLEWLSFINVVVWSAFRSALLVPPGLVAAYVSAIPEPRRQNMWDAMWGYGDGDGEVRFAHPRGSVAAFVGEFAVFTVICAVLAFMDAIIGPTLPRAARRLSIAAFVFAAATGFVTLLGPIRRRRSYVARGCGLFAGYFLTDFLLYQEGGDGLPQWLIPEIFLLTFFALTLAVRTSITRPTNARLVHEKGHR